MAVIGTALPDILKTTDAFEWVAIEISGLISLIGIILILFSFREIAASQRRTREAIELKRTAAELEVRNELLQRLNKARKESEAAN